MFKMLDNFSAPDRPIENSNSKSVLEIIGLEKFNALNATDRSFCRMVLALIQSHFWFVFLWFEIVNWLQK